MKITTLGSRVDRFYKDGDSPFEVLITVEDGRQQTVLCWAADEWKARTRSMFLVDFKGTFLGHVDYKVTALTED